METSFTFHSNFKITSFVHFMVKTVILQTKIVDGTLETELFEVIYYICLA